MSFLGGCAAPNPSLSEPLAGSLAREPIVADSSALAYKLQAERFFIRHEYQRAVVHFQLALVHDSHSAHLHLRLSKALGQMNSWLAALSTLEKGLLVQPDSVDLKLALGKLYRDTEDYVGVERVLSRLSPGEDGFETGLLIRLDAALWENNHSLAHKIRVLGLEEYPDMACSLGHLYEDHGLDEQAKMLYERCTAPGADNERSRIEFRIQGGKPKADPGKIEEGKSLNLLGEASVSDTPASRRQGVLLRREHRQNPDDCMVLYRLGNWYWQRQDLVRAQRYVEVAYGRCHREPEILLLLVRIHKHLGEIEKAEALVIRALKLNFPEPFATEAQEILER